MLSTDLRLEGWRPPKVTGLARGRLAPEAKPALSHARTAPRRSVREIPAWQVGVGTLLSTRGRHVGCDLGPPVGAQWGAWRDRVPAGHQGQGTWAPCTLGWEEDSLKEACEFIDSLTDSLICLLFTEHQLRLVLVT